MVMYSVGLVEKGDKNKGKMDDTMFTRTVFWCRQDENIFKNFCSCFWVKNDHFGVKNGHFNLNSETYIVNRLHSG